MSVVPTPADGFALPILSDVLEIAVIPLVRCETLPDDSCSPFRRVVVVTETEAKRYDGRAISNLVACLWPADLQVIRSLDEFPFFGCKIWQIPVCKLLDGLVMFAQVCS